MGEDKRRSEVKSFVHRTEYGKSPHPAQRGLFDQTSRDWPCTLNGSPLPAGETQVLVRVNPGQEIDVIWCNEIVAKVTDQIGQSLAEALSFNQVASNMWLATIVAANANPNAVALRF